MDLQIHLPLNGLDETLIPTAFLEQLQSSPSRKVTFFDETITGYLHLTDEVMGFGNHVADASIYIDLAVIPDSAQTHNPEFHIKSIELTKTDLLFSSEVNLKGKTSFATVWKFALPILYPKKKVASPQVFASIVLTLRNAPGASAGVRAGAHDVSDINSSNILSDLQFLILDKRRASKLVSFSRPQVLTALPDDVTLEQQTATESTLTASVKLPVYPALIMRLKSTKSVGRDNVLFSTLELESSKELMKIGVALDILNVETTFTDGRLEEFLPGGFTYPVSFLPSDILNFTYKLHHDSSGSVKPICIKITSIARSFDPFSSSVHATFGSEIVTSWATNVDFGITPPAAKKPPRLATSRKNRLRSSSDLQKPLRLSSSSLNVAIPRSGNPLLAGLVITFSGQTDVRIGEVFRWKVQAINKSPNRLNLSLYIQARDMFEKSQPRLPGLDFAAYPAPALQKMYNAIKLVPQGILPLANDIKIGPLDPGAVYETTVELIAIERGIFNLEGVRIIDIASGEGFDCGKLLEVVVM
ncbi:hypothetical protein BABINDRAFT_7075 [Babjeviella inositovora NRRL Y-12698]|uniref:Trafficking protein particle complex II-specific subunit 65 IgD3 domain-containing protein n=1 Tax=Babjeviella inositovora NRRL Y-12698 TaxID=984486 RepID=A0A1E3QU98_9ASCO|nr:uncharacterized protein BABINDRAFT_7075 [Babjeviella inositovora NRRL Y-12698]ODQ81263.1 hypothetical protein BABINDRAFT_7075 [Babjeviella inositovora NRRL Y-12698]